MAAPRIFYRAKKRRGPAAFVFMMVLFKEKFLTFCNSHGSQKYQRTLKAGRVANARRLFVQPPYTVNNTAYYEYYHCTD